jgi:hypothetical protein
VAITHRYTLICDDVRREDNGKMIVLGMYLSEMILPQIPFQLPSLTFFSIFETDRPGNFPIKFKLQHLESGRVIVEGHGGLGALKPGPTLLPLKLSPIKFEAVGVYSYSLEVETMKDSVLMDFTVTLPSQVQGPLPPTFSR